MDPTLRIPFIIVFCLILITVAILVVAGGDMHISQAVSENEKYTASLMGRRENSETPYADFVVISEDTILKDTSAENAVFIGYCKPITLTWLGDHTLNISCHVLDCGIQKKLDNWRSVSITFELFDYDPSISNMNSRLCSP